jgi:hypothetical protein
MFIFKSLIGSIDPQVSSFTKILQHNRGMQIGPDGSVQGMCYQIGFDRIGNAQSPEAKLACIMKEYVKLRSYDLDSQISVIEYRVFGLNCGPNDPSFVTLEDWVAWRLPRAFKNHNFIAIDGWTVDFYKLAKARAVEHFV